MDPVSQGVVGASMAQAGVRGSAAKQRPSLLMVALLGAWGGMAPDLDVLIRSSTDPLLFLEFHRQFTHALIFIPFGALFCAAIAQLFVRGQLRFRQTYLFCLLGYATHALLDACTSYGTQLLWPFTNERIDWSNVSVVDPLFTLPLLLLVWLGLRRGQRRFAYAALLWAVGYLLLGVVQRDRALEEAQLLADERGLQVERLEVKPAFASLLLWKSVCETPDAYYIDGIRTGLRVVRLPGERVQRFDATRDLPWLDPETQQARDIKRFDWFSQGYLASSPDDPNFIIDVRYSMLPNEAAPLWGILLDPSAEADAHVAFVADRDATDERLRRFWSMLSRGIDPGQ